jgi:hypothetical protein
MNRAILTAVIASNILTVEGGTPAAAWDEAEARIGDSDVDALSPIQVRDMWLGGYAPAATV